MHGESRAGMVTLIGAGPGDPGLMTVKGLACLRCADVVIYDYLVDERIVREGRPDADYVYVGKKAGQHTLEQDEINALLIERARAGKTVARLKGGDPFVFGRGGEEAEALIAAGIAWQVVPGVTSAVAGPAYAGIPVTHRALASSFTVVTGHEDPAQEASDIDWAGLGRGSGTLIFLMGVGTLDRIATRLITHGRSPDTPAAVIRWGTTTRQQTVSGTLADIADRVRAAGLSAPAVTIVGAVVGLGQRLAWHERRPLWGRRVVITRAAEQAPDLAARLEALGAATVMLSTIQIAPADPAPLDAAIAALGAGAYGWVIFTSVNGVAAFFARLDALALDCRAVRARVAAIGPATARALAERGLRPDFVPTTFVAEAVAEQIGDVAGQRVLLPRADIARPALADLLAARGASVEAIAAYRTIAPPIDPDAVRRALAGPRPDAICFTSSSTVRGLVTALGDEPPARALAGVAIACIGPVTAATARECGLEPTIVAESYTMEGLTEALLATFG